MFAPLLDAVRADIDRQVGWARDEIRRQIRYAAFIGVVAGMGTLAALGALIDGLIALHSWLAPQVGSPAALGMIGAGLLLLMVILLLVAFSLRRPGVKTRPAFQTIQSVALFRTGARLAPLGGAAPGSGRAATTASGGGAAQRRATRQQWRKRQHVRTTATGA